MAWNLLDVDRTRYSMVLFYNSTRLNTRIKNPAVRPWARAWHGFDSFLIIRFFGRIVFVEKYRERSGFSN